MQYSLGEDGWLHGVRHAPSPNYDARPDDAQIRLLVIHNISLPPGEFGRGLVEPFFCNALDTACHPALAELAGVTVSAHFFIDRTGVVTQFVSVRDRAWHAGESCFLGQSRCNDFSVGIELEGTDHCAYSDAQYAQLGQLIRAMMATYPAITVDTVVGHEHIAAGRKTDPGPAFDWPRLHAVLNNHCNDMGAL
jgi:AmpD protein